MRLDEEEDRREAERAQHEEHALAFAELEAGFGGIDPRVLAEGVCSVCQSGDREEVLMLCDACQRVWTHTYCLEPPLPAVPEGEWVCSECLQARARDEEMRRREAARQLRARAVLDDDSSDGEVEEGDLATRSSNNGAVSAGRGRAAATAAREGARAGTGRVPRSIDLDSSNDFESEDDSSMMIVPGESIRGRGRVRASATRMANSIAHGAASLAQGQPAGSGQVIDLDSDLLEDSSTSIGVPSGRKVRARGGAIASGT